MTDVWRLAISILLANVFNDQVGGNGPSGPPGILESRGFPGPSGNTGHQDSPGSTGLPGFLGQDGPNIKCPSRARSAFTAKFSGRLPPPSKPVVFTNVLHNEQRDLEEATGVFICRKPGNYHFSFDVKLHHCKVSVQLMRNHTQVLEKHQLSSKENENISSAIVMPLKEGDKVWLETEVETEQPEQAEVIMCFSGFLV